jgi:hypothetical protein
MLQSSRRKLERVALRASSTTVLIATPATVVAISEDGSQAAVMVM